MSRLTPPKKNRVVHGFLKTTLRANLMLGGSNELIRGRGMFKIRFEHLIASTIAIHISWCGSLLEAYVLQRDYESSLQKVSSTVITINQLLFSQLLLCGQIIL